MTKAGINPKRILIVEVNWIGDVIFSTPFIRAIRNLYPKAYIACLIAPRTKEVLDLNPSVDKLIIYDEKGIHRSLFGKLKLINEIRSLKFDTAIFLHRSITRRLIAVLSGIKNRIGYASIKGNAFLTEIIEPPLEAAHKVDYFLKIAGFLGADVKGLGYEFYISKNDAEFAKNLLRRKGIKEEDTLVVINPGGNWDPKRWPRENFAKLSDRLVEKYGVKIVITGARKDIELANDIESMMRSEPVILAGATNLKQLGAILKMSSLVIANDSGPMHIANSLKVNTVALFGPTKPDLTGPYGKENTVVISSDIGCEVPCYNFSCDDFKCMKAITVEDVIKKIDENKFLSGI